MRHSEPYALRLQPETEGILGRHQSLKWATNLLINVRNYRNIECRLTYEGTFILRLQGRR